ncbi:MAG: sugar ABC transporter permease, partial [Methylobacterium sp.]|nr:sugar ABC transporter permease [Methylobacterium sp.]
MTDILQRMSRDRVFYLFVAPFAALTILFGIWPILLSIQVSFTASATSLRPNPAYVGLANYAAVLADPIFLASLSRTLLYTLLSVIANLAFALFFAVLLDSTLLKRGNLFFRLAIFLPVITPDVAGYVVWRWLYDRSFGAINAGLKMLGLPAFGGLSSVDTAMLSVLIAELWH